MTTQTVEAVYDGKVLRPKKRLELKPNASVMVTVKPISAKRASRRSSLEVIEKLKVDAPSDWSENIAEYLPAEKRV